jgi:hypothetical protein
MKCGVSISALSYNLRMIVIEDGGFRSGTGPVRDHLWDIQTKHADIIAWHQVIEQMHRMSA